VRDHRRVRRATTRPPAGRLLHAAVLVAPLAVVAGAAPAAAHTGLPAGGAGDGLLHPVLGWDHLLAMVAVGVLAATVAGRRVAWWVPAGFVGGMTVGGLAGLLGLGAPLVETAIAMSVVALGGLVVAGPEAAGVWLPAVAAAFGAAHGHAHGAELPAGAVPAAYVAGFVAATAALHLLGAAVGVGLRRAPVLRVLGGVAVTVAGVLLTTRV
jgi:urease accessory protein